MSSTFPNSLDSLVDPTATSKLNSPSHSQQHVNSNDALEKIEAKVGVDASAVTTTHDYKLSGVTGTDKAASLTGTEILTNKTLTTPTVTGGTLTKPTVTGSVQTIVANSDGATITFDLNAGNVHTVTLGGNRILALSNPSTGQYFSIELTQDGTGSRTVTWFSTIRWIDGVAPTLTTTAAKRDTFVFRCTGTGTYDGYIAGQNL
jgi:hypothetical protein